jgi:alpha-mannosidase
MTPARFTQKVTSIRRVDGQERALTNPQPCTLCTYAVQLERGPQVAQPHTQSLTGRTIQLPPGTTRVQLIMNADGDRDATIRIGDVTHNIRVQDASGFIGQWDTRIWEHREETLPPRPDAPPNAPPRRTRGLVYAGLTPGYIKPAPVDSFALTKDPYQYAYRFAYTLPATAATLTLPDDPRIHIFDVIASDAAHSVRPLQPLYDTLHR